MWFTYFLVMVLDLIVSFETFCCLMLEELIYMQYGTMMNCCCCCFCCLFIWIRDLIWIFLFSTQSTLCAFHDSVFSWDRYLFGSFSIKMNHNIATCRHLRFWFISPSSFCTDFFLFATVSFFFFCSLNMISFCDMEYTEFWIVLRAHQNKKKKTNDNERKKFSLVFSILLLLQLIYLYFEINAQDHVFK